jgi:ATP-binding cassette subfamily F protein uup
LVEHLFVFEGEGEISDFPGNYSEFREVEKENGGKEIREKGKEIKEEKQEVSAKSPNAAPTKAKASFKQKNEFKEVTASMAKLEKEKAELTEKISGGNSDHEELMKISSRMLAIDAELEELELTWLELSELDGIE